MNIISVSFLLFALGLYVLYYLLPKRFQWGLLLIFSMAFYALGGISRVPYILIMATSIWGAARLIQRNSDQQKDYSIEAISENSTDAYNYACFCREGIL